ncbi:MAG: outer membrane beta-barrel protein [Spirochaetota bacterium]
MKKAMLTIFTLLLFTVKIFGEENKPASRNILDLMYFPTAGTVFIMPSFTYTNTSAKTDEGTKIKGESQSSELEVGYGLTNQIALSLAGSYYFNDYTKYNFTDDTSDKYKYKGFTDPEIKIAYRPFENNIICDFYLTYSPKLIKSKDATSDKKGTEGRGGHEIDGGIQIGKKIGNSQFMGEVSYAYFTERKTEDAEDNSTTKTKGGDVIYASLEYQYNVLKDLAFNIGFSYGYVMEEKSKNNSDNSSIKSNPYNMFIIPVGIKYAIIPQQLSIEANYAYCFTDDQKFKANGSSYKINDYRTNAFGIGLLYQF